MSGQCYPIGSLKNRSLIKTVHFGCRLLHSFLINWNKVTVSSPFCEGSSIYCLLVRWVTIAIATFGALWDTVVRVFVWSRHWPAHFCPIDEELPWLVFDGRPRPTTFQSLQLMNFLMCLNFLRPDCINIVTAIRNTDCANIIRKILSVNSIL